MKTYISGSRGYRSTFLLVFTLFLLAAVFLFIAQLVAADPAAAASTSAAVPSAVAGVVSPSLWQGLIPVIVPLVLAALKFAVPKIPKALLPILAPLLGAATEILLHYAGLTYGNGVAGALLGASGVGVREIYDQVRKLQASAPAS